MGNFGSFSMLTCNKYFRLRNFFCRNHHQGRIWCYFKNHLSSFLLFLTFLTLTWSILSMVKKFAYFKSFPSNYSPNDVQNRNAEWKLDKNIFIEWKIFQNGISFFLDNRFNRLLAQSKILIQCYHRKTTKRLPKLPISGSNSNSFSINAPNITAFS